MAPRACVQQTGKTSGRVSCFETSKENFKSKFDGKTYEGMEILDADTIDKGRRTLLRGVDSRSKLEFGSISLAKGLLGSTNLIFGWRIFCGDNSEGLLYGVFKSNLARGPDLSSTQ